MKHAGRFILIVAVAATAMAVGARAGGDKNRENHQKRWSGEKPAVEAGQARDRLQARDRDRDGSCTVEGQQKRGNNGRGEGDRLRDGSCQD